MSDSALQGSLLRLVVLCSTGLSTYLPSEDDSDAPQGLVVTSSKDLPTRSNFSLIQSQIHKDVSGLVTEIGKRSTNLSLALKKSKNSSSSEGQSPTDGLDTNSLKAAQEQIESLSNDLLPKLIFLSQKALKEQNVYLVQQSQEDRAEREKMEKLAKELGGQIMTGAQLGISSQHTTKFVKQINLGIGSRWATILKTFTQDLLTSIASLGESCMNIKTKQAVLAAQQARDRFDGTPASAARELKLSTRQECLTKLATIWETCDHITTTLPKNNTEAIKTQWKQRSEMMQDGFDEMKEALEDSSEQDDNEDDDELDLLSIPLSPAQKVLLQKLIPLIKLGRLLFDKIGTELNNTTATSSIDLDELDTRGVSLSECQDDLVAALLYGEVDNDDDDSGDDEEEEEEEEALSSGVKVSGTRAVAELYIQSAQSLFASSNQDDKVKMILEEMVKVVDGVQDQVWKDADAAADQ
ncbi:unnamed protein product [Sympodiomycopsis kandeliae]